MKINDTNVSFKRYYSTGIIAAIILLLFSCEKIEIDSQPPKIILIQPDNNSNFKVGNDFAEYNYEYDTCGNLIKSIFPKNIGQSEADRMYYKYDYDPTYSTYITKISDARGLSSTTT
jgi:hypothetical protein